MGIGAHTLPNSSAVVEPATGRLDFDPTGSGSARVFERGGHPVTMIELPGLNALMAADGLNPMRILVEDKTLRVGIPPPGS